MWPGSSTSRDWRQEAKRRQKLRSSSERAIWR